MTHVSVDGRALFHLRRASGEPLLLLVIARLIPGARLELLDGVPRIVRNALL
jgi:hypothetical protein